MNILNVWCFFRYFSWLLESSKDYIRRFASESFAFLMRKVRHLLFCILCLFVHFSLYLSLLSLSGYLYRSYLHSLFLIALCVPLSFAEYV